MQKTEYIIDANKLREEILRLKKEENFNLLLDIICIDYLTYLEKQTSRFALVYIFTNDKYTKIVQLKVFLEDENLEISTISDIFYAASWAEREIFDQFGIIFQNHLNLKRILNHHDFVGNPLRKDYFEEKQQVCTQMQDLTEEMNLLLEKNKYNKENQKNFMFLDFDFGKNIRNFVAVDGELIKACCTEIGYLHRGFEKFCEKSTYLQIAPYVNRSNYYGSILNNIGYCKTIEEMLELEITPRAQFIRVIAGELSRIIDHIVCNALGMKSIGDLTSYYILLSLKIQIQDLLFKLCKAKTTNSYIKIGGLAYDLYDNFSQDLESVLNAVEENIEDILNLVEKNKEFHKRTQNIGTINKDFALNAGITGVNLRATGVNYDIRKTNPYYFYEQFDFDVILGSCGDVYDRLMCRFEEIRQSIKIVKQAIKNIPDGKIDVFAPSVILQKKQDIQNNTRELISWFKLSVDGIKIPKREFYSSSESSSGELGFFIVSDNSNTPYRLKYRSPSFYGLGAYSKIIENNTVEDAIATMASLNFLTEEFDR